LASWGSALPACAGERSGEGRGKRKSPERQKPDGMVRFRKKREIPGGRILKLSYVYGRFVVLGRALNLKGKAMVSVHGLSEVKGAARGRIVNGYWVTDSSIFLN